MTLNALSARHRPVAYDLALRGREDECAVLDGLVEGARAGRSGVLVVRGEAGIGKSALLDYAIESAPDLRVARAVGVESEMELAFAALHQLCAPMLDRLDRLPGPQRDALATTFGLSAGPVPDRFLVGLATLSLLEEPGEQHPLLCVVDDAQWLDRASAQALAFVARRLLAESVVLLLAAREPSDEFAGLPELMIEGLRDADARDLLALAIPGRLDERVADQLVAEARGNPLALLELPRGLSAAQLAGGFGLPGALPLERRIEASFLARLHGLPEDTQLLLLVAAAEPAGDLTLFRRAANRLAIGRLAFRPAEAAGLIEIDSSVRFRHPLVRSAVYRAAAPEERRRVHQALAEATDRKLDPDRRAWHLAEATIGADEDVAAELEGAAGRAQARGGLAAAAAFLERAATLTPKPSRRARRALAAAHTKYEAGALDDALTLLVAAELGTLSALQRAQVDLLHGQIAFAAGSGSDAPPLLLKAARKLEAVDESLARATYLDALQAAMHTGRLSRGAGAVEISEAALAGPPPPRPPRPHDLLLQGLAVRFTEGFAAGAPMLKQALSGFQDDRGLLSGDGRWLLLACRVASDLWDDEAWKLLSTRMLNRARSTGALTVMPRILSTLEYVQLGELAKAQSILDASRAIAETTGTAIDDYGAIWLAAMRGHEAELSQLVETTARAGVARGEGVVVAIIELASSVLYNGLGRYDEAVAAVRQSLERSYDGSPKAVAELIEAAARSGDRRLAERALLRLTETTRPSGTDWALGVEARSRALLRDGGAAESLYREAIERLGRTGVRVQLARAHLVYGEWLRRERRRVDAREQLRLAHGMFTSMGTEAFAARAARELLATGERVGRRRAGTRDELTPQEAQVARLASDGLSNGEIGGRLFISQHTVAYHLRKVFGKLEIRSRNQLGRVLNENV